MNKQNSQTIGFISYQMLDEKGSPSGVELGIACFDHHGANDNEPVVIWAVAQNGTPLGKMDEQWEWVNTPTALGLLPVPQDTSVALP